MQEIDDRNLLLNLWLDRERRRQLSCGTSSNTFAGVFLRDGKLSKGWGRKVMSRVFSNLSSRRKNDSNSGNVALRSVAGGTLIMSGGVVRILLLAAIITSVFVPFSGQAV